jgi:hypothetical protein
MRKGERQGELQSYLQGTDNKRDMDVKNVFIPPAKTECSEISIFARWKKS